MLPTWWLPWVRSTSCMGDALGTVQWVLVAVPGGMWLAAQP
nr:hypothetical protein [Serratia proteamaculans]